LIGPYASYSAFVENQYYDARFVYGLVPGALTGYDLCDLAALFAPNKLIVAGPVTTTGYPYPLESFTRDWEITRNTYESKGHGEALELMDVRYFREDDFHDVFDRLVE